MDGESVGENRENPNFDSPNITSADVEIEQQINAEEAERKKAETVDIDGVPISEDEVAFKAEDIKKKGKTEYFVNVEGAEQRRKEAERQAREEAAEAEREAKEAAAAAAREEAQRKAAEDKAKAESAKKQHAEDDRVIAELKKKASTRKKQNRDEKRRASREKHAKSRATFFHAIANFFKKLGHFFFGGWRKFITIFIILLAIGIPVGYSIYNHDVEMKEHEQEERQRKIDDIKEDVHQTISDSPDDAVDVVLEKMIELDDIQQDVTSAINILNWAALHDRQDIYDKYLPICRERGGCNDGGNEGGKG